MGFGLNLLHVARAVRKSQGTHVLLENAITNMTRVNPKIYVCLSSARILSGPKTECKRWSPGNPGIGISIIHDTMQSPRPATPVGCSHCSLKLSSSPSQGLEINSRSGFTVIINGDDSKPGASLEVRFRPTNDSTTPQRNVTKGAEISIWAKALLLG